MVGRVWIIWMKPSGSRMEKEFLLRNFHCECGSFFGKLACFGEALTSSGLHPLAASVNLYAMVNMIALIYLSAKFKHNIRLNIPHGWFRILFLLITIFLVHFGSVLLDIVISYVIKVNAEIWEHTDFTITNLDEGRHNMWHNQTVSTNHMTCKEMLRWLHLNITYFGDSLLLHIKKLANLGIHWTSHFRCFSCTQIFSATLQDIKITVTYVSQKSEWLFNSHNSKQASTEPPWVGGEGRHLSLVHYKVFTIISPLTSVDKLYVH